MKACLPFPLLAAVLLASLPAWVLPTRSQAQAGSLDPAFNVGTDGGIFAVTAQPDGKVVLGGNFTQVTGVPRSGLARINVDGSLDGSFLPPSLGVAFSRALALTVQPDGKVLVAGNVVLNGSPTIGIARLNADGSMDASFKPQRVDDLKNLTPAIVVQSDGKILFGGAFTTVGINSRGHLVRLLPTGSVDQSFTASTDGSIASIALQGDGKVVLCGSFSQANGQARPNVARLNADGSMDTAFNASADFAVSSVVVQPDGRILLGGNFTQVNGVARRGIARLNFDGSLDTGFNANLNSGLNAVSVQPDGKIIIPSLADNGIRRLNANGSLDSGFHVSSIGGAAGTVNAVTVQPDGKILLGGQFTTVDGVMHQNLARLLGDASVLPPVLTSATSIAAVVGQPLAYQLTAINGPIGFATTSLPPGLSLNSSIGLISGTPTQAGTFSATLSAVNAVGMSTLRVTFNVTEASVPAPPPGSLSPTFNPGAGADGQVRAVAFLPDGRAVIGGAFSSYLGTPRSGIARINADGTLDTSFNPGTGTDQLVNALLLQADGKVVLGGDFTVVSGVTRNGVARLNADGSVDTSFDARLLGSATASSVNPLPPIWLRRAPTTRAAARSGFVASLTAGPNGTIVVGGAFQQVANAAAQAVARLNAATGAPDPSFTPASGVPNGAVRATVTQPDGKTIIGGDFSAVGSVPRNGVARLNVDGSLDGSFDASTGAQGGPVDALALQPDGAVVIGGDFTSVDNQRRGRVARVQSNGTLDPTFDPGSGANGTVRAVTRQFDGKFLLGGAFTQVADAARNAVARLNADGSPDKSFDPGSGANAPVNAIALRPSDGSALLGGDFTQVGSTPLGRVALIGAGQAPAPTGAVVASVVGAGPTRGGFVLSRTGSVDRPVTVFYHNGGSAIRDQDYVALPGTAVIPAGQSEVVIPVTLLPGANRNKKVKVLLDPSPDGSSYSIAKFQSKVFLSDLP